MASDSVIRNLVIVGKTGNGKSATGNTILGLAPPGKYGTTPGVKPGFRSGSSLSGITRTSEMKKATIGNETIKVIDTPGLFDASTTLETVSKEIVRCMTMAKEGVHAFIGVISTWNRFTEEEAKAFQVLEQLFGPKALDYMIIVFTVSKDDDFADIEEFKNEYLSRAPKVLQAIVEKCDDRILLINNLTKDAEKKKNLAEEILYYVNETVGNNGGKPYSNEYFERMQEKERKRIEVERKMKELRKQNEYSESQALQDRIDRENLEFEKQMVNKIESQLMEEMMKIMKSSGMPKPNDCCSIL